MLKSISLQNFKCFKDDTTIDIAPLTVLCGVNSSGKSSILKSLLMLKQSYENESTSHSLLLSGEYVDNGSFDDVVYHENRDDISKDATFKTTTIFLIRDTSNEYGKNLIKRQDVVSFKELKRVFYQINKIKQVKYFKISIEVITQRPNESSSPFEFYVESNVVKSYKIDIELLDNKQHSINNIKRYVYIERNNDSKGDNDGWLLSTDGIPSSKGYWKEIKDYPCTCYFSGLQIKNIYADSMIKELIYTLPNILSIFKIAAFQSDGFSFIAPLREQPVRRYNINGDVNSVGISGEATPILLAKEYENIKTDCIPPTIVDNVIRWNVKRDSFKNLVSNWMNYFNLGAISLDGSKGLVEININNHNIVDVGFGVSQALPIIVQGLYMTKDQSLLLEQPEIHLHPEMQLQMADFLIALAYNEKNIIVETHSDHIVNRIIKRIMENPDLVNGSCPLINIIFLDKDSDYDTPKSTYINIDRYKGVTNGSEKFFTQFGRESMDIAKNGYDNYKKDNQ